MGLFDFFRRPVASGRTAGNKILHTPYGDFNLARESDRKKVSKIIVDLKRSTDALTHHDLADWRAAWQWALSVENPDRRRLYDIYRDVDADLHLSGCISQRVGYVLAKSFKLVNADGEADNDARHLFDQIWFKDFLRLALESKWWGHSLIQLGDVVVDGDGCPSFSEVRLVPRKHVKPEYHRFVVNSSDHWKSGVDYREAPWSDWLIEVGRPDDLGLFLKAATQTIPKKNTLAFWDAFAEMFGMPIRIARTTSRDPKEKEKLEAMMDGAGSSLAVVTGMDTEIEFVETGKSDAYNVYDRRIDRANSELSKLVILQTMTIEDGSSRSQSETHLEVFENLVEDDRDALRDVINNRLIPLMIRHGFPVAGLRFEWDDAVDYTPEQQVAYETMIADRYEVDPEYFAKKYNMPVGRRISAMQLPPVEDSDDDAGDGSDDPKRKNARLPFFD